MQTGTVKWFDASKGFGFVIPESGGADIYVHLKVLQKAGIETSRGRYGGKVFGGKTR